MKRKSIAPSRTGELTETRRQLKQEISRRQTAEESLTKSKLHYGQLLARSQQMEAQIRHLARRTLLAQEEERKLISRELHDDIAQTLAGINVYLAALKVDATINTKGLGRNIARTQRLVEKSVNIVHRFARQLRPTVLDDLGLIPALHAFLKEFTKRTGILIRVNAMAGVEELNGTKRMVLYRVAQEAMTNIAKHAHASRVKVDLKIIPGAVRMEINDDGKSFVVESVLFAKRHKHLGLIGMRERVEMVGGSFSIESAPGQGTKVCAQIPFGSNTKT